MKHRHARKSGLGTRELGSEACPICGAEAAPHDVVDFNRSCVQPANGPLRHSGVPVYYFLCAGCGFCYAPQFRKWTARQFEQEIYNDRYVDVDPDYREARPAANARLLAQLFPNRPDDFRHLDYGGGSGLLSGRLRELGWRSETYDPFHPGEGADAVGKFDLITAFEVFEHVPDPIKVIQDLRKRLKEDGFILFSTLVSDGVIAKAKRLDWWYVAPRNGHISLFTRQSLKTLGETAGLQYTTITQDLHYYRCGRSPSWAAALLAVPAGATEAQSVAAHPNAPIRLDPAGFNAVRMSRHGPMVYNRNDVYIGQALEKYGESSWEEHLFLEQLVRPGDVVIEVGANMGVHTVALGRLVEPGGAVLAFEPQRIVFQTLCANLALNQCTNVFAFNEALGSQTGEILVPSLDPRARQNFGGLSLIGAQGGDRVRMRTIDALALAKCRLIKADVEGMELEVLRGAVDTIARLRPLLYVENDRDDRSRDLLEFIFNLGYEVYWHTPRLFNADNYAGEAENIYPDIVSVNMLCIPAEAGIKVDNMRRVASSVETWKSSK